MKTFRLVILTMVGTFLITFLFNITLLPVIKKQIKTISSPTAHQCLKAGPTSHVFFLDDGCAFIAQPNSNFQLPGDYYYWEDTIPQSGINVPSHGMVIVRNITGHQMKVIATKAEYYAASPSYSKFKEDRIYFDLICQNNCFGVDFLEVGTGSLVADHFER